MKQINIIYILNSPTKHGGANKSFLNMIEGFIGKGINPVVIIPYHGDLCEILDKKGINYYCIPFFLSIYPRVDNVKDSLTYFVRFARTLIINFKAYKKLLSLIESLNPEIIHTNVGPLFIGYRVAKKLNIPHFWHLREYQDLDFNMTPLFSKRSFISKLKKPNNYPIAISKGIYEHFLLSQNARVIVNGVFKSSYSQFNEKKQDYFLYAGRLEEKKGIRKLIEAFIEFAKTNNKYNLYIAGSTKNLEYEKKLTSMVEKSNNENRIKFLGMRDDISDLMRDATSLVVPSHHEGFGRITVEAMFNGCLVIGNNTGGTKEIIEKENLGILYSGHNQLIDSLKKVSSKGIEFYYPTIRKAQIRSIELYSQEKNSKAVFEFYTEILNNN